MDPRPSRFQFTYFMKELESIKKKQAKEIAGVVKSQCTSIEKASKGKSFKTAEEVFEYMFSADFDC